ncbi:Nucleolar GTP-binding protein 1 [Porphyridium purpureum]|uniref:Nucleolar GTP-binding protein 1 n=1 Tax=Porphyridium purpureum TaxID=35688 RepID=A0A5J4Z626_PORPP|nr:Nucleolar GTP-binding protein 1 [Porphyridium purpureum]|eukprot:POR3447..scf295_1
MVVYNFKKIQTVPTSTEFVDVVLSRTQRKTPTVVHKGYAITRIRAFYMRKVKYTQSTFHEKLTQILDDFPRLEELHPFYADLINVLYDRDHYKLALGQLAKARSLVDGIAKDYLKLLKYGDSLYRCKQLKRAALGRMCTLMKRHTSSLQYLEQVRQHMGRLPSIDPATRTLLVAGFPNVGKSSFMNKVTRADVDVQPYAFTTKSLFVGHMDYKYLRWQVIDTPGILDHSLEERNTIEMQSITALAHLRAAVLFFIDPSEQCGYALHQQIELLRGMAPLFQNKPLIVVLNKTDLQWEEELSDEHRQALAALGPSVDQAVSSGNVESIDVDALLEMSQSKPDDQPAHVVMKMSSLSEQGIAQVRSVACDLLLRQRVDAKLRGKRMSGALNRLHVAQPAARDARRRPPVIPSSVQRKLDDLDKAAMATAAGTSDDEQENGDPDVTMDEDTPIRGEAKNPSLGRKLERDRMWELGGPGVFASDWRREYRDLQRAEWAYDIIPEIVDGHNIADFVDPDIEQKLLDLEREEEARVAAEEEVMEEEDEDGPVLTAEQLERVRAIREKRAVLRQESWMEKTKNRPSVPASRLGKRTRVEEHLEAHLNEMGMHEEDAQDVAEGIADKMPLRKAAKRRRLVEVEETETQMIERKEALDAAARKAGFANANQKAFAKKVAARKQAKIHARTRQHGDGDRHIPNLRPRHLFSGKRGMGKTQRR